MHPTTLLTAGTLLTAASCARIPRIRNAAPTASDFSSGDSAVRRWHDNDKAAPAPRDLPNPKALRALRFGYGRFYARDDGDPDDNSLTATGTGDLAFPAATGAPYPTSSDAGDPDSPAAPYPTTTDTGAGGDPDPTQGPGDDFEPGNTAAGTMAMSASAAGGVAPPSATNDTSGVGGLYDKDEVPPGGASSTGDIGSGAGATATGMDPAMTTSAYDQDPAASSETTGTGDGDTPADLGSGSGATATDATPISADATPTDNINGPIDTADAEAATTAADSIAPGSTTTVTVHDGSPTATGDLEPDSKDVVNTDGASSAADPTMTSMDATPTGDDTGPTDISDAGATPNAELSAASTPTGDDDGSTSTGGTDGSNGASATSMSADTTPTDDGSTGPTDTGDAGAALTPIAASTAAGTIPSATGDPESPTGTSEPERMRRMLEVKATMIPAVPKPNIFARQQSLTITAGGSSSITSSVDQGSHNTTVTETVYASASSGISSQTSSSSNATQSIETEIISLVDKAMAVTASESTFTTIVFPCSVSTTSIASSQTSSEHIDSSVSVTAPSSPRSDGKATEIVTASSTATARSGAGKRLSPWLW